MGNDMGRDVEWARSTNLIEWIVVPMSHYRCSGIQLGAVKSFNPVVFAYVAASMLTEASQPPDNLATINYRTHYDVVN